MLSSSTARAKVISTRGRAPAAAATRKRARPAHARPVLAQSYKEVSALIEVPAYKGKAVAVKKGQYFKVINTHGQQVVDFWAMMTDNVKDGYLKEIMSMHHSHDAILGLIPKVGDTLVTSRRRPILTLVEDTGPGVHDTTVAACDHFIYEKVLGIGPDDFHDSCTANLHASLAELGFKLTDTPDYYLTPSPFNLWMNVPVAPKISGNFENWWAPPDPRQKPGDHVVFKALENVVCVMSACPASDISPINGPNGSHSVHCQVLETV